MAIDFDAIANTPKKASSDAGSVETHSIKDLIEVDKYARGKDESTFGFGTITITNGSAF